MSSSTELVHVVLVRLRADVSTQELAQLAEAFSALPQHIAGLNSIRLGIEAGLEAINRGYSWGFVATFDSQDALAAYQAHPAHKNASSLLLSCAQGGIDGVLVFDLFEQPTL